MSTVWNDIRYAFRMLRKSVGFTSIAVVTLALGIGANTTIFSIIDAVLLKPLPFLDSSKLVLVWETDENRKIFSGTTPPGDFFDWRAQNHVFENLAAFQTWWFDLTGGGEAEQVWGANVTANFLDTLKVKPELGRSFVAEEEKPGSNRVAMISHRIWATRYGSDPHIVGKSIILDYKPCTVVGVLPAGFNVFGTTTMYDVLTPLAFAQADIRRDNPSLIGLARLKPGISVAQANTDMKTIQGRLAAEYPEHDAGVGVRVVSMHEDLTNDIGNPLRLLMAAVGLVLLIACANVANLLLSRGAARQREVAVRAALGARRWRLIRQLLTESVLLSFIGGAAGLLLAYASLHALPAILPQAGFGELHNAAGIGIHVSVLIFTLIVTVLTGVIFGLAPAFQSSRVELNESLKESGRGAAGGVQSRITRNLLVVTEIGLSVILLVGAATLIRAFHALMNQDPGFNPHGVLSMQILLKNSQYDSAAKVRQFFDRTLERMRALPGVQGASAIDYLPLTGYTDFAPMDIEGRAPPSPRQEFVANYRVVMPAYFHTIQIPLMAGRYFDSEDIETGAPVVLISASFAKKYWPDQNPIGRRVRPHLAPDPSSPWRPILKDEWRTIVGVVGDERERWDKDRYDPELYFPFEQAPSRIMRIMLRTGGNPAGLAPAARQVISSVDKNQPVTFMRTMDDLQAATVSSENLEKTLLAIFAVLALVLAGIGIYGVISYGVEQRAHEIGIRMALGAQRRDVVGLVVKQGFRLILLGLVIGIVGSLIATRLLAGFLFGLQSFDAPASAVAVLVLAAAGLLACYIPARRATRIDPMHSLRYE